VVHPGHLESAYRRELQRLLERKAVARLWAQDVSLWPAEANELESIKNNLRWLELPKHLGPLMDRVVSRASQIEPAGLEDVVLVSLGFASFAAEAILKLPSARLGKRTLLLRSIDPDAVQALEKNLRLERALLIFVNKLGKDLDNHALFLYFFEQMKARSIPSPAVHFVALAEENSYLVQLAGAYDFIDRFLDPPGIIGRYSSLIHFNFYLAAAGGYHPGNLVERARAMQAACSGSALSEANPAALLGAVLAAAEQEGSSRLVFFSNDNLLPVAQRMGCLVGASTCANGRGLIPILARSTHPPGLFEKGCLPICVRLRGNDTSSFEQQCQKLREAGSPLVTIELNGPEEFAAELFKWEIATALACSLLEVNPFREPDPRQGRLRVAQILEPPTRGEYHLPSYAVRVRESSLELYAEGQTRRELSTLSMAEALRSFLSLRRPEGYLALLPFLDVNGERSGTIGRICEQLESRLDVPVLVADGPRYLHCMGELFSAGPPNGLVIVLTAEPQKDLGVPGAEYTLGEIQTAMAQAEFESLVRLERPVLRLHLTNGADLGLGQLEMILNQLPRA